MPSKASGSTAPHENGPPQSSRPRLSSESGGSGTAIATIQSAGSRGSSEKSRAKKLFGRSSADKESSANGHADGTSVHKRSESMISNGKRSVTPFDDGPGSSPGATEVCYKCPQELSIMTHLSGRIRRAHAVWRNHEGVVDTRSPENV